MLEFILKENANEQELSRIIDKYDSDYYAPEMNLPLADAMAIDDQLTLSRNVRGINETTIQYITLKELISDYHKNIK